MKKIKVELIGKDGNIFNLLPITCSELKKANQHENAKKLFERITKEQEAETYYDAIRIIGEYVEII